MPTFNARHKAREVLPAQYLDLFEWDIEVFSAMIQDSEEEILRKLDAFAGWIFMRYLCPLIVAWITPSLPCRIVRRIDEKPVPLEGRNVKLIAHARSKSSRVKLEPWRVHEVWPWRRKTASICSLDRLSQRFAICDPRELDYIVSENHGSTIVQQRKKKWDYPIYYWGELFASGLEDALLRLAKAEGDGVPGFRDAQSKPNIFDSLRAGAGPSHHSAVTSAATAPANGSGPLSQ